VGGAEELTEADINRRIYTGIIMAVVRGCKC